MLTRDTFDAKLLGNVVQCESKLLLDKIFFENFNCILGCSIVNLWTEFMVYFILI
jgi:hypothetical protein